jgi:7-cyano-7-deazaguanine synthase
MTKKAIILLSGGLDSTTCLAIAKQQDFACYALSFAYEHKHIIELKQARHIAQQYAVIEHKILSLPLGEIGGSSLTDAQLNVPDYDPSHSKENTVPNTYVPARNTIFLSLALAWGEVIGAYDIFYGANNLDYSNYCDCRPDYIQAFETLAQKATQAGVMGQHFAIHAPLLEMHKAQIIQHGMRLGVDYSQTISCYRANHQGHACGTCDSCTYRKKGFIEAGVLDPTVYI